MTAPRPAPATAPAADPDGRAQRSDAILESVDFAARQLLRPATRWEEAIDAVLARLGQAAGASRVYVFQNREGPEGRPLGSQRFEWVAPGVSPQLANPLLQDLDYAALGWGRWAQLLGSGEVVASRTRDLPAGERPELEAEDILAIVLVPISAGPAWWGFIGFDECRVDRAWSRAEVSALRAGASTVGAAVQRQRAEEALLEREAQYRRVFEETSDGLVITDLDTGTLVDANRAFCRMHGYELEELLGRPATTWVHPDNYEDRRHYARAIAAGGEFHIRTRDVRKDGSVFPVDVHGSGFTYQGRPHALGVVRDDTARAHAFTLLEQRVAALARIAASLTVDQELEPTLAALAGAAVEAGTAVAAAVQLVDDATGDLRLVACHGLPDGYAEAMQASWRGGVVAPTTEALHRQELVVVHDAPAKALSIPEFGPLHPLLRQVAWDTVLVVPLDAAGRTHGAVNLYYRAGEDPSDDEVGFLRAVADQGAVAVENARLLAAERSKAGLEERQRLARELHDSVSQALYGIALGARTARTVAERDPAQLGEPLDYVLSLAEAALAEMRSLIFELRPESLEQEGLVAALDKRITAVRARHGITVRAELGGEPDVPLAAKEALYRIAQEALNNVIKHAPGATVDLVLATTDREHVLDVRDDGPGFDPAGSFPGHLGLSSMRERAELVGGRLVVVSAPGRGTAVTARLPVAG